MSENRDRVVSVRLTDDEYDALMQRAEKAGKSLSGFMRDLVKGHWALAGAAHLYVRDHHNRANASPQASVVWSDGQVGNTFTLRHTA